MSVLLRSRRLRLFRQEHLLTSVELARRCAVAVSTLRAVESGQRAPGHQLRAALAREFGVSERILFPEGG